MYVVSKSNQYFKLQVSHLCHSCETGIEIVRVVKRARFYAVRAQSCYICRIYTRHIYLR